MPNIFVTGCGTDIGKTIVSAILASALGADYWKPIQCGNLDNTDSDVIARLTGGKTRIFPSTYTLKTSCSPHMAARLEDVEIDRAKIIPPQTNRPLIIETAGGPFVPLNATTLNIDLFSSWEGIWIVVSKNYLGSINHTLLTIDALKNRSLPIAHLIFNGPPNPDSEEAILHFSQIPLLGKLLPHPKLSPEILEEYAKQWRPKLTFAPFGIPTLK